jgi:hypothetical protein
VSIASDDQGLFHVDVQSVLSSLKFGFIRGGELRIEVASDVREVRLSRSEAKALRVWLEDHEPKEGG